MVPASLLTVMGFLLFIAPGLLYDKLARGRKIVLEESTFREISRIVLSSLAFCAFGSLLALLVNTVVPALQVPLSDILGITATKAQNNSVQYFVLTLFTTGGAFAAVGAYYWLALRGHPRMTPKSAWVTRLSVPKGATAYVRVYLLEGAVVQGAVVGFSADLEMDARELVLGGNRLEMGDSEDALRPVEWFTHVIIPGAMIRRVAVAHVDDGV